MAHSLRAPPHVLSALSALLSGPDGPALSQAIGVSLERRKRAAAMAPERWTLDAAVQTLRETEKVTVFGALRLLQAAQPLKARLGYSQRAEEDPARIDQALNLGFARTEVTAVDTASSRPRLEQTALGLLGPNGALPYAWTEHAHDLAHASHSAKRDTSFIAWINLIQRRQLSFVYRAWSDTDATAGADRATEPHPLADRLRALAGLAYGSLQACDQIEPGFKLAFSAVLSRRVRSPQPLAAMLGRYFEARVRVEEFAARWLDIPQDQQTCLGLSFGALGRDAVAGARVWDCASRFRVHIGPLSLPRYREFFPGAGGHARVADLVHLYAGVEFDWELAPQLEAEDVPEPRLGGADLRLGWSAWLGTRVERTPAADLGLAMTPHLAGSSPAADHA